MSGTTLFGGTVLDVAGPVSVGAETLGSGGTATFSGSGRLVTAEPAPAPLWTLTLTALRGIVDRFGAISGNASFSLSGPVAVSGTGTVAGTIDGGSLTLALTGMTGSPTSGPRCTLGDSLAGMPARTLALGFVHVTNPGFFEEGATTPAP